MTDIMKICLIICLTYPIATQSMPAKVQGVTVIRTIQGTPLSVTVSLGVSWNAVNGSGITYTVCYSTTSGTQSDPPSDADCDTSGITGTSTTLGPLSIGTTYYIWVAAVSSSGRGPYSDRKQGRTFQAPSRVNPPSLTKAIGSGRPALRVNWTAPSSELPITKYQVQYRRSGRTSWRWKTASSTSTILEKLSTGSSYQVRVRAVSDVGDGPFSDIRTITTYRVPQQVSGVWFEVDTIKSDPTVTITWENPSSELPITHYWVDITENDTNQYARRVDGDTSLRINVTSGSTYSATVMAVSAVGSGTPSERVTAAFILEPYVKEVSPTSGTINSGLSAGLFVVGLVSGIVVTLLVVGIIWGACKLLHKKSKDSEVINMGTDHVEMVDSPAYESINRI